MEGEGEGGQVKESSDALTSTGSKAPKSSHYVDLSEYPPGTDIEYELHWDGSRVVSKVPRWAHEKWLRKYQNTPQDTSPTLRDAAAADGGKQDRPNFKLATASGLRPHVREALASRLKRMVSLFGPERLASPGLGFKPRWRETL